MIPPPWYYFIETLLIFSIGVLFHFLLWLFSAGKMLMLTQFFHKSISGVSSQANYMIITTRYSPASTPSYFQNPFIDLKSTDFFEILII